MTGSSPCCSTPFHKHRLMDLEAGDHLILQMGKLRPGEVTHLRTGSRSLTPHISQFLHLGNGSHSPTLPASQGLRRVKWLGRWQWLY